MGILNRLAGISDEDIEWANSLGAQYSGGDAGGIGSPGDAARHIALGWLAARADEQNTIMPAKKLAQLREYSWQELNPRHQNPDGKMDLHNNEIGFSMAAIVDNKEDMEEVIDSLIAQHVQIGTEDEIRATAPEVPVVIREGYKPYTAAGWTVKHKPVGTK